MGPGSKGVAWLALAAAAVLLLGVAAAEEPPSSVGGDVLGSVLRAAVQQQRGRRLLTGAQQGDHEKKGDQQDGKGEAVQLTVAFQILDFQGPAASDSGPYAASSSYGGGAPSSFYNLDFFQVYEVRLVFQVEDLQPSAKHLPRAPPTSSAYIPPYGTGAPYGPTYTAAPGYGPPSYGPPY